MSASPPSRPVLDIAALVNDIQTHGLVVVAGAGLSMSPPSSLPGWTAINRVFLDNLALLLARHTEGQTGYDVANFIVDRAETVGVASPDFQAQFAEEALGAHYFELFKPLDIGTWNPAHAAIAALASTGLLRAVVTTNFDRLTELAMTAAGARPVVYASPSEFEALAGALAREGGTEVPVIKVHGSVERRETLVDTLRQRVQGRPAVLETTLAGLFSKHAVLIVGFSGADLGYDPHYLGLRKGAKQCPSLTVIQRPGEEPKPGLVDLVEVGEDRARWAEGELPGCLVSVVRALKSPARLVTSEYDVEMDYPGLRQEALRSVVASTWASSISPVQATVVLASIARAAGSEDAAFRLLTGTMPFHLRAGLHADPALTRQVTMMGGILTEACHVDGSLSGKRFAGDAALTLLTAKELKRDAETLAWIALGYGLCGCTTESDSTALAALKESRDTFTPPLRSDVICLLARIWALSERWSPAYVETLRQTYQLMTDWGDEPRRARVGGHLARFLIEMGQIEEATEVLIDSQRVVVRLQLAVLANEILVVIGRLHLAEKRLNEAFQALNSACGHFQKSGQNLRLMEALLPLGEAAALLGDQEVLQRVSAGFDDLLPLVPGMALPQTSSRVRLLCAAGAFDLARNSVANLRALGESWNEIIWIPELADRLDSAIAAASRR